MMNVYLAHHGIIGQKWGVRRFQNEDGSLTPAGRERYYDDDEKISKGTKVYRVANSDETFDSKRKYVSVTANDRKHYSEQIAYDQFFKMMGQNMRGLPIDYNKPVSEFTFEAKRDLRVASGRRVTEELVEKYASVEVRDLINKYHSGEIKGDDTIKGLDVKGIGSITVAKLAGGIYETIMREHADEIMSDYMKRGYDAIVDPTDWEGNITEYPVILLNPADSTKKLSSSRVGIL